MLLRCGHLRLDAPQALVALGRPPDALGLQGDRERAGLRPLPRRRARPRPGSPSGRRRRPGGVLAPVARGTQPRARSRWTAPHRFRGRDSGSRPWSERAAAPQSSCSACLRASSSTRKAPRARPFEIVAGVVVAPLDLDLDRAQPYGSRRLRLWRRRGAPIAPDAEVPLVRVQEAGAVAGRGLTGDRYAAGRGTFSGRGRGGELTLIEAEALEELAADGHHGRLGASAAQCRHARHRPQRARRPSLSDRWCRVRRPQARRAVRPSAAPGSGRHVARTRAPRRLARGPARERHDPRG